MLPVCNRLLGSHTSIHKAMARFTNARPHLELTVAALICRIMGNVKDLDSTAIYAWTTLISVLICVPCAVIFEGGTLKAGMQRAAEAHPDFYYKLAAVGLLYHLYNQVITCSLLLRISNLHSLLEGHTV